MSTDDNKRMKNYPSCNESTFYSIITPCKYHIWACSKKMKPKRDIGVKNETVVIGEIVTPNKLGLLKVFKIV